MDDIQWLSEAVLCNDQRVYCAGTLAQCVRRWTRLDEAEQGVAIIKLGRHTQGRQVIAGADIGALAQRPEAHKL